MSANLLQAEKIQLIDFKIIKEEIIIPSDFEDKNIQGHHFDVNFTLGFNLEDKLIKANFCINIETKSDQENAEEATALFEFAFVFHVDNMEELTKLELDNSVTINPALGNALAAITYSTSRGILMMRFQTNSFRNFILPVINPNTLID